MLQKATKFRSTLYTLLVLYSFSVNACDICGCFMGITPYDNQSQISFLHRYRAFNGYKTYNQPSNLFASGAYKMAHGGHDTTLNTYAKSYSSKDYESYKILELRVKYFVHKRIELNAIVPFNFNKSKENNIVTQTSGIGDPTFYLGYHIIRRLEELKFQHRLISGAGIKLPSGNYYAKDNANNRIPLLLQTGTGSVDYFAYLNYVIGYKKIGMNANVMYKINGKNYYQEKIDNSASAYLNFFYKILIKKVIMIPSIQSYYEYTNGLIKNDVLQAGTKMNSLLVGPGLDLTYKNLGLNFSYQFRAYEETQGDNLRNAGRIMVGLNYNFNQRNYLLGKKTK